MLHPQVVSALGTTVKTPAIAGVKLILWPDMSVLEVEERRVHGCSMLCLAAGCKEKAFPSAGVKHPPLWLSHVAAN